MNSDGVCSRYVYHDSKRNLMLTLVSHAVGTSIKAHITARRDPRAGPPSNDLRDPLHPPATFRHLGKRAGVGVPSSIAPYTAMANDRVAVASW